jgi:hypothetical protein
MKLSVGLSIFAFLCLATCGGIILAITVTGWQNGVVYIWDTSSDQIIQNIQQVIEQNLNFVKFASKSIYFIVPPPMPTANFTPTLLIRMFDAYDGESGFNFGSFGFLTSSGVGNQKFSWQIAKGFGCPEYIYAYSDASINPRFLGNCAYPNGTVDWATLAYNGVDWGLKPEEQALVAQRGSTFLPIFNLLGQFTLTFETSELTWPYVSFAELSLTTFTNYVATNTSQILGGKTRISVYETQTNLLVASNFGPVVDGNGTRIPVTKLDSSTYIVKYATRKETGLDWTVSVGVQKSVIYGNMYYNVMVAGVCSMVVIIVCITCLLLGAWYCIMRPLQNRKRAAQGLEPYRSSSFSDVREFETH